MVATEACTVCKRAVCILLECFIFKFHAVLEKKIGDIIGLRPTFGVRVPVREILNPSLLFRLLEKGQKKLDDDYSSGSGSRNGAADNDAYTTSDSEPSIKGN